MNGEVVAVILVMLATVGGTVLAVSYRKRHWVAMARRHGLEYRGSVIGHDATLDGQLPGVGAVKVDVRQIPDDESEHLEATFAIGSDMPGISSRLLPILGSDLTDGWTFDGNAFTRTSVVANMTACEVLLARGLALARCAHLARDFSPELIGRLENAGGTSARSASADDSWTHEVRAFLASTGSQLDLATQLRFATLIAAPDLLGPLASPANPPAIADAALTTLITQAPGHAITLDTLDCRIDAISTMSAQSLERLAVALRKHPHPRAEVALMGLTAHASTDVRLSAVESLREIGTIVSVPTLTRLRDRSSGTLSNVAASAITHIQARAVGATVGGLALAEHGEAGALSMDESLP